MVFSAQYQELILTAFIWDLEAHNAPLKPLTPFTWKINFGKISSSVMAESMWRGHIIWTKTLRCDIWMPLQLSNV